MLRRFGGLWQNPNFLKLLFGQTISLIGSQVTFLALPLTAILSLKATPMQMGILGATQYAPFLLFGLFVGVWVDHWPQRTILIVSNLGRAVLLAFVPAAALLGWLRIEVLYIISFLAGILTVFFDIAYMSFLPALVRREDILEGNGKLQASASIAYLTGPSLAGGLIQWMAAPMAILVDSFSFIVSSWLLLLIRLPNNAAIQRARRQSMWSEIGVGLRMVLANPILRAIVACSGTSNFFINVHISVRLIYLTRELNISPAMVGIMFAVGSVGGLIAALLASRLRQRFGIGRTVLLMQILIGCAALLLPLLHTGMVLTIALLIAGMMLWGFAMMIYDIIGISLRQIITPERLQGRMTATFRFITWGVAPLGALLGGALGELIGLRPTLLVAGAGILLAALWIFFSPVRALRQQPTEIQEPTPAKTAGIEEPAGTAANTLV
jgi:MFS family permease